MDYKKLGLKCGIEIHQQLDTQKKLFCNCYSRLSKENVKMVLKRRLRPVAGELGDIDAAAAFEALKNKEFHYNVYPMETCTVEMDSEPPHPVNQEALEIALQIALMLNCDIPDELHVMRKTVIDGSNTSGFQRTVIVGLNGFLETSSGKVGITNVCLEEDSAQIIKKERNKAVFGLDRLGIPLVEIGTDSSISNPQQAKEVAEKIGMILKSTRKVKKGLGTIRQDLNVSIKGGSRVEIKGVQSLSMIPQIIEKEIIRQKLMVEKGKKVPKEVRKALSSGSTSFLRPLPGSSRLYPETDLPPIRIDREYIKKLKDNLPELISEKEKRVKSFGVSEDIVKQLRKSDKLDTFERLSKIFDPKIVAIVLTSLMKQLKSEGVEVEKITEKRLVEMFQFLRKKPLPKEGIMDLMKQMVENPSKKIEELASDKDVMDEEEVRKIVKKIISEKSDILKQYNAEKIFMGLIMKEIRGRASGALVIKILREEMKS